MKTNFGAFQWVDISNTGRSKPPYLQGYEDGLMKIEMRDWELYEDESRAKNEYEGGYLDADAGLANKLEQA